MKKIFVTIIVIGLLLSTSPLSTVGEEAVNEQKEVVVTSPSVFLQSKTPDPNDEPPRLFDEPEYVPGEVIVKFKEENDIDMSMSPEGIVTTDIESIDELNAAFGIIAAEKLIEDDSIPEFANVYKFSTDEDIDVRIAAEEYNNDNSVEFAEPNYKIICLDTILEDEEKEPDLELYSDLPENMFIPNDPYFDMQWALHNTGQNGGTIDADIDAPEAWNITRGDEDVVIAILDSGVDYTHPDLGNCTDGITELEYSLESKHPLSDIGFLEIDFAEIFSEYDFDSISLHLSRVDIGVDGILIIDSGYNSTKSKYKELFNNFLSGGNVTNLWTPYSELGITDIEIFYDCSGNWGFAIDKIRLHKWEKLSKRCPEKYVDGYDFVYNDPDPMDDEGHGTHCAGIASAVTDNDVDIAGVAGNCKIMPVRVFSREGGGANIFSVARGIIYATRKKADILSISLGGQESILESLVLNYAYNKGTVIIAAAGNDNMSFCLSASPASHEKVIAVSATDRDDMRTWWSNHGSWVDVAAPGYDILSLRAYGTDMYLGYPDYTPGELFVPPYDNNATLIRAAGTSMSCPHVAGVAALILSKNSNLNQREVLTVLRSSTDPVISQKYVGTGRINAFKAVQKAASVIAELDNSLDYKNIVLGKFKIKGTAKGEQFENYVLEYSNELYPNETGWTVIDSFSQPKNNEVLCIWDTSNVDDGVYTIRVRVTAGGYEYEDRTIIIVDNIAETYYVDYDNTVGPWLGTKAYPYRFIQNGVDVAGRSDTIYVLAGIYNEQLYIDQTKAVTITGENKHSTIIDNTGKLYGAIIACEGQFHISNFTIKSWIGCCSIEGYKISNSKIYENVFTNSSGMILAGCVNCVISGNTLRGGIEGWNRTDIILTKNPLWDSSDNEISGNIITYGGIYLSVTNRCTISDNTISNSTDGISLHTFSSFNDIYDNCIINNNFGICVSSSFNDIYNNCIANNNIGIALVSGVLNRIYLNNFIDNGQHANDSGNNIWYRPVLMSGNYWDDYEAKYPNAKKIKRILLPDIWDTPYDIPGEGGNQDKYPLVEPCEDNFLNNNNQQSSQQQQTQD